MPFVSRKQQRWGHTKEGEKALGGPAAVAEWDHSTHLAQGGPVMNKGYLGKNENFASGGPVLGRTTDFLKTPDRFAGAQFKPGGGRNDEDWEKKGKGKQGDSKSLKPVKPQK
jgi:hypothetical protein